MKRYLRIEYQNDNKELLDYLRKQQPTSEMIRIRVR